MTRHESRQSLLPTKHLLPTATSGLLGNLPRRLPSLSNAAKASARAVGREFIRCDGTAEAAETRDVAPTGNKESKANNNGGKRAVGGGRGGTGA